MMRYSPAHRDRAVLGLAEPEFDMRTRCRFCRVPYEDHGEFCDGDGVHTFEAEEEDYYDGE